jgi:hypothetical protein
MFGVRQAVAADTPSTRKPRFRAAHLLLRFLRDQRSSHCTPPRGGGSGFSPISIFALTSGTRWRDCRSFIIESKEFAVISESFDSRTLSKMEIALDRACLILPAGCDKHGVRRLIAGKILECAQRGDKTLSGLTAAGYAAAIRLSDTQERSRVG